MAEISLTPKERQALKARAHALKPVVLLGAAGLTAAVIGEIDRALSAHELIKVRVPGDDRAARESIWTTLADTLSAARVQAIGKLLVLYRPAPAADAADAAASNGKQRQPIRPQTPGYTARKEVEKVRRPPATRRDPGSAHRAAGRRNAPKRAPKHATKRGRR